MALVETALSARAAPFILAVATGLEMVFLCGSLDPVALSHDEAAYLLQARIFASGHWTAPGPPLPEFFEQYHVLVTPVLAAKYPPGNSFLMAPGVAAGLPALGPVVCAGVAGGFLFLLARRFSNPWAAILAWLLWTAAPGTLRYLPGYFSQNVTVALWLVGWWGLANWREKGGARWLSVFAAAVAWGAVTRPFTTLAFAAAGGAFVLVRVVRNRAYRELALACVPALAILLLLPVWSRATTGSSGVDPYRLWSRTYLPFDRPGFGVPPSPAPLRELPPDMRAFFETYRQLHARHLPEALLPIAAARAAQVRRDVWGGWRATLIPFFVIGLVMLPREAFLPLAAGLLLFLSHLIYAHDPVWSLYYVEAAPVLAWITAVGVWAALSARLRLRRAARTDAPREPAWVPAVAAIVLVLCAVGPATADIGAARLQIERWSAYHEHFRARLAEIVEPHAVVFVRYGPQHVPDMSLIRNAPEGAEAPVWVVYDRGEDNARLLDESPERTPYLYDEATGTLVSGPPAGGGARP